MKAIHLRSIIAYTVFMTCFSSCQRNKDDVWEDTKSAGRHVSRSLSALTGNHCNSRQIANRSDFECVDDEGYAQQSNCQEYEYTPLEDLTCDDVAMADMVARPPRDTPGEHGSSIPGIDAFRDPSTIPQLAAIFKNIYFEYNSNLVKGSENLKTIQNVANYMKSHPNSYVFIEGHTDERGPQAYNLALGSRRSNSVRNLLISEGVNPDNLFTISYGKERPLILEQHEEGWSKNRRSEFKIYER
jgi:peptidoglycan-associated lipoprotein